MTDILYAAKGGSSSTSDLYTINPSTAAETSVGATGHAITGLAVDPTATSTLYAAASPNSSSQPKSLLTLDTSTGAATLVGAFTSAHVIADICFDSTGQLYGWDNTTKRLVLIDKATGALTQTAAAAFSSAAGNGLDCNATDVLYACLDGSNGDLRTINKTTGARTDLGGMNDLTLPSHNTVSAVSFSPGDVMYGIVISNPSLLVTIDTGSLVVSLVGTFTGGSWDALAWSRPFGGGDVTPPTRVSMRATGNTITITYDEALEPSPGPSPSEFAVTINGVSTSVTAASASGINVTLTIADEPVTGDVVLVSYTA